MWSKIQTKAFRKALMKIGPFRFILSEPACEKYNFYTIWVQIDDVSALVRELKLDELLVLIYNPQTKVHDIDGKILLSKVNLETIKIIHYLYCYELPYVGVNSFLLNSLIKKDFIKVKLKRLWNLISQSRFNRSDLKMKPRHELLSYLIDKYGIHNGIFGITQLEIDIYTLRFFKHPNIEKYEKQLSLYVDSFVESGEVSKIEHGYKVNGKAIVTLEKFEAEERRHKDSVRLQYSMVFLTCILAILASVQAGLIKLEPILDFTQ